MCPFPRLKFERLTRGMSQTEVGKLVGLTQTEVSQIERRRMEPTSDKLRALARWLDVPAEKLLDETRLADDAATPEEAR